MSSPGRSRPDPFWLCHECGAQMRPITIDDVPHCASCNGEFIEILDAEVNPDPFHELPLPPPTRPLSSSPPRSTYAAPSSPHDSGGGFMQSLFNILGAPSPGASSSSPHQPGSGHSESPPADHGRNLGDSSGGGRAFAFNLPGGGQGRVVFGRIGGQIGGMGPFGPLGGDPHDGLGAFFPGFPPPPPRNSRGRQGQTEDPLAGQDLLRALVSIIAEDGAMGQFGFGPQGRMDMGDYVMSQQGFDQVLEQLMQAAGPQGPLPASDIVIEGLPRFTFDEKSLGASPFRDCPVCKDDFTVGDRVMRIPCTHIFHPDCLQPWLKVNGSCPVCRFSLLPEEGNRSSGSTRTENAPDQRDAGQTGQSTLTNILNRLWGQSGTTGSNPTSPSDDESQAHPPFAVPGTSNQPQTHPGDLVHDPPPARLANVPTPSSHAHPADQIQSEPRHSSPLIPDQAPDPPEPFISSAIPEDYRARHRQREREQHEYDDLD